MTTRTPRGSLTRLLLAAVAIALLAVPASQAAPPFYPDVKITPVTRQADSPDGLDVTVSVEQNNDPDALSAAHLKDTKVVLPEGLSLSPSAANDLEACTDAQFGVTSEDPFRTDAQPATCPAKSILGTVGIDTLLLDHPNGPGTPNLTGTIYLGQQKSSDPESGYMYRIFMSVYGQGVRVKLLGRARANPRTGQVTTTFVDSPQLPFATLTLRFRGGNDAPLATPATCGVFTAMSELTPYTTPYQPSVTIAGALAYDKGPRGGACVHDPAQRPFAPTLVAGTDSPAAAQFSPLTLDFSRADGEQELSGLTATLPRGQLASLKGVPLCTDAQVAEVSCPASTRVGTATVAAGPGDTPFTLRDQPVYLTTGYKGGAYGLAVVVRALAGPFDLGTVTVRQSIRVDPVDAHLSVVSDPFPTILGGVPLRMRRVQVRMDRKDFTLNGTSCAPKSIVTTFRSLLGRDTPKASRHQLAGCPGLRFDPRLAMKLSGRNMTTDGRHPGLSASVTQAGTQANIRDVLVRLPKSLALDPNNANGLCEYADGLKVNCPAKSIVGRATAYTPLLNRPLRGPVYFVKHQYVNARGRVVRGLPSLLVTLRGEIDIDVRAYSSVKDDKLETRFSGIPDARINRFDLKLNGGKNGILVVSNADVCARKQVAGSHFDGHNGKRALQSTKMGVPCGRPARLKVTSARMRRGRIKVSGRVAKGVPKRIKLAVRCGKKTVRATAKARKGRWSASLRCGRPGSVTVRYPGDKTFEDARASRRARR